MSDFYEIVRQWPLLSAILGTTTLGLVVVMLIPADRPMAIKKWATLFAGIDLVICILLFVAYDRDVGGLQFVEKHLWVEALGIYYFNAADGINLPM
ncbi:MAG: NADH-quinone oxidoreductase subunit M, partial [Deltaproteobacteria bacterium]|nr:NADH-quinone oxidoreductase subunit M [Deltaproteobacteria bacterium]